MRQDHEIYDTGNRSNHPGKPEALGSHAKGFGADLRHRAALCHRPRKEQGKLPDWQGPDGSANAGNQTRADAAYDLRKRGVAHGENPGCLFAPRVGRPSDSE